MYGDKSYRQNIEDLMLDLDRKRLELMYDFNSSSDEFERRHYKYRIAALDDEIDRLDRKLRYEVGV